MVLRVEPGEIDAKDVLELADALIEDGGWAGPGQPSVDSTTGPGPYTLHHAIGRAADRLTANRQTGTTYGKGNTQATKLRDEANRLIKKATGKTDIQLNDQAGTVDEILSALRRARA